MKEDVLVGERRTRWAGLRAVAAGVLGLAYVVGAITLLLALIDRGVDGLLHVQGLGLVGGFLLLMAVGLAAIWVYPYDRPSRHARPVVRSRRPASPSSAVGARRV